MRSMPVLMMRIRLMRMSMHQWLVSMPMAVSQPGRHRSIVTVLMVFVVHMFMLVGDGVVDMLVLAVLDQVQLDTEGHQAGGAEQGPRDRLIQQQHRQHGAAKWGH